MLEPITIRQSTDSGLLKNIVIAAKRPSIDAPVERVYMFHIEGAEARISETNRIITATPDWTFLISVGPAISIALEFDCYWVRKIEEGKKRWRPVTVGEPWFFWVTPQGQLWARQGVYSTNIELVANGVTKVAAIRGWKSVVDTHEDQGVVVGYIRNGVICYRNYAEQDTSPATWAWESEKIPLDGDSNPYSAVNIGLARTNDYRTAFLYETSDGEIHWLITTRSWAGMGIPPENIGVAFTSLSFDIHRIFFNFIGSGSTEIDDYRSLGEVANYGNPDQAEHIKVALDTEMLLLWAVATDPVVAENISAQVTHTDEPLHLMPEGLDTEYQTMWYPLVSESESITIDGTLQTREIDYTIDTNGLITFETTPDPEAEILATYTWVSWGHRIKITFNKGIDNVEGWHLVTEIEDSSATDIVCAETFGGDPWSTPIPVGRFDGTREMILRTGNFNLEADEPVLDITVNYTFGAGQLIGEAGQEVGDFEITFTPVNLIEPRLSIPAPEVEEMWNE